MNYLLFLIQTIIMHQHFIRSILTIFLLAFFSTYAISQDTSFVLPLWKNGAPGFENRRAEPELAKDWWVKNVHNPSLTVFLPPKKKATGAAVLICPGGGHRNLGYNGEGVEPAKFLNSIGVAAFVLKYRLFREENSPYTEAHAKEDGFRAMRLIRSRAAEWQIDLNRIGMMGFSAGGEVVSWVAYDTGHGNKQSADTVEWYNSKPSFQVLVYPGPLGIPTNVTSDAPPAFLVAANDDACCASPIVTLLNAYRKAEASVEIHLYAKGDHAFNMGNRSPLQSIQTWRQRLADWLKDNGWLLPK